MPAKLDRCVKKVKKQGKDESSAYAICSTSTGIKRKKGGGWKHTKESVGFKNVLNKSINEMLSGDVVGSSGEPAMFSADTYATGDARLPKVLGMVSRRGAIKDTSKRKKKHKSKNKNDWSLEFLSASVQVQQLGLEKIVEDMIKICKPISFKKERGEYGDLNFYFEGSINTMTNFASRLKGLLHDRINHTLFVEFNMADPTEYETSLITDGFDPAELKKGTKEELKDKHTKVKKKAEKIAKDHLREHPKYYSKLDKCFKKKS